MFSTQAIRPQFCHRHESLEKHAKEHSAISGEFVISPEASAKDMRPFQCTSAGHGLMWRASMKDCNG